MARRARLRRLAQAMALVSVAAVGCEDRAEQRRRDQAAAEQSAKQRALEQELEERQRELEAKTCLMTELPDPAVTERLREHIERAKKPDAGTKVSD